MQDSTMISNAYLQDRQERLHKLKCYFCDAEARGTCSECSRGTCKDHASTYRSHRPESGIDIRLVCNECNAANNEKI